MKCNPLALLTAIAGLMFFGCQKASTNEPSNAELETQIVAWLLKQQSPKQPNKAANIDLLSKNLQFSELTTEDSHDGERLIIIPVKEEFKQLKKIENKYLPVVVLKLTKAGDIRVGNLVLFAPAQGQQVIPKNTFYNIFNTAHPQCDGTFKFQKLCRRNNKS